MKLLTWLLGVLVILLGVELARSGSGAWPAVWYIAAAFWLFVGCVLTLWALGKRLADKMGAGGRGILPGVPRGPSAPDKD